MSQTIEFEYEWSGIILNCKAEFEGEYRPPVMNPDDAGFGPAEYPELTGVSVTICNDSGNETDFDVENIYDGMPRPELQWIENSSMPVFVHSLESASFGHYFKKNPKPSNPHGVWEYVSLQSKIEEEANEVYMEER